MCANDSVEIVSELSFADSLAEQSPATTWDSKMTKSQVIGERCFYAATMMEFANGPFQIVQAKQP